MLESVSGPQALRHFGTDLSGIELRADDLDWSFGSGQLLAGAAQDLALVVCGRKLPAGLLRGEQARPVHSGREPRLPGTVCWASASEEDP